jgi:hypothetical protein
MSGTSERQATMAIAVYFHPKGMTMAQFEDVHARLKASGNDKPKGRIHHSCIGDDGDLMVYDIWESEEAFGAFGEVLMPIIGEVGFDAGQPDVLKVHRLEQTEVK